MLTTLDIDNAKYIFKSLVFYLLQQAHLLHRRAPLRYFSHSKRWFWFLSRVLNGLVRWEIKTLSLVMVLFSLHFHNSLFSAHFKSCW